MSTTTIIKGGGSSFENAERCNQFADRVQERLDDGERVAVVVSTPNFPGTSRTTDKLKLMAKYREGGSSLHRIKDISDSCPDREDHYPVHRSGLRMYGNARENLAELRLEVLQQFRELFVSLELSPSHFLDEHDERLTKVLGAGPNKIERLVEEDDPKLKWYERLNRLNMGRVILSWGEETWSPAFAQVLRGRGVPAVHVDARRLIRMDYGRGGEEYSVVGKIRHRETYRRIAQILGNILERGEIPVMGGFIGAHHEDNYRLVLERGGSDTSATLIARGLNADRVDICTDVPGVYPIDPGIMPEVRETGCIPQLSYQEQLACSCNGAQVVHSHAIGPLWEHGMNGKQNPIPMRIVETRTGANNTIINQEQMSGCKAIGGRSDQDLLRITDAAEDDMYGFAHDVTGVLTEQNLDVISTENSTFMCTFPSLPAHDIETLEQKLHDKYPTACINYRSGCGTVVLVGHDIEGSHFSQVERFRHNIRHSLLASTQGPTSITFVVPSDEWENLMRVAYSYFTPNRPGFTHSQIDSRHLKIGHTVG